MKRSGFLLLSLLLASLAAVASLAAAGGRSDMLVPRPGMQANAGWKAQPVKQTPLERAWENIRVNTDRGNEAQNEPAVAVNPLDPQHMVVGANSWVGSGGDFRIYTYATFDGGKNWTASEPYIERQPLRRNAADATIAFGPDGAVYIAFTAFFPAKGAIAVSRSADGGLSWTQQTWASDLGEEADKPALAAANGKLYVFWQSPQWLFGRTSADGGKEWGQVARVARLGRNAAVSVDPRGSVDVFYTTAGGTRLDVARARDAGKAGLSFEINTVGDVTALQSRPARYRAGIIPTAAADAGGNLHVAWADGRNQGSGNDVLYSRSEDGGRSWSKPVRVNDDAGASDQLMPALATGTDGAVYIAWLDNRDDPANYNYNIYMARASGDLKFEANTRVTSVASNPDNDQRIQGEMIGDYFALAAAGEKVVPVWTDTRNLNQDIYLAPVEVVPTKSSPKGDLKVSPPSK